MVVDALADQLPDAGRVILFVVGTEPRECLTYLDPQGTDERPIFLGWARVQRGGRIDRRGHRTPPNVLGRKVTADRSWSHSGCRRRRTRGRCKAFSTAIDGVPSCSRSSVTPRRRRESGSRTTGTAAASARCWARSSAGSTATIGRPTAFEIHVTSPWRFGSTRLTTRLTPARSSRSPASPTAMQARCTLAGSGVVTTRMRSASRNAVLPIRASVDSPASGSLPTSIKTREKRRRSSVSSESTKAAGPSAWRAVRGERSRTTVARAG